MQESTLSPPDTGTRFKHPLYELLCPIGQGGFGQVYKARQRTTEREVAIKLLRPPPTGDEPQRKKQLARFRREMRICARLFHPHIVHPIDSGQTEEGVLYSVFELVPGQTLADVLSREGAMTPREAIRLMLQVLDALDCAHQRGVIHRDIKPHNLMVSDTGARRNMLVLDFGLSTLAEELQAGEESAISSTFDVMGTPAYAAPEQLRGQPADMRSDLYSWALVHLECLTGERVMRGRTMQEVLQKQLSSEPVPLPDALEGLRLGGLLRQALAKNIRERDVTAASLLRELEVCEREESALVARRFAMGRSRPAAAPGRRSGHASMLSEGQVRQLTALCCGISLGPPPPGQEELDTEEQDELLRGRQKRCIELVEKSGGYLGGVLGRQMMFYFGYPTAREDAPRCAARAALELLDEARSWGAGLELRLGIHSGLAIIRDPRADERQELPGVLGSTPMSASQYQEMAAPGEALVTPDTHRLLRNDFAFESVHRLDVRTQRQLEVSRLSQPRTVDLSRPEPPMVGRAQELELLLQRWNSVRQGVGQAVLLMGEPGIGKSRLTRELLRALRGTPHVLLEGRCAPEDRASALRPVIDLLEHQLGWERGWTPERSVKELEALLSRYGFELEEAVPLFASLLSIPLREPYSPLEITPEWQKALTFDAVLNLLVEMAAQQPVLLVVEDLHWADPTTLELLAFLLDTVPTARLGVILTARSEFVPSWPPAQVFQLQLGRLSHPQVDELVTGLTQGKALPPGMASQVAARTDGIPLFVEELTRMMLESGPLSQIAIPGTLRGLLEARLDRLGRSKETAELASLLGREFTYELLSAISPRDERTLQAELSALVAADLLQHRRRLHNPTYVFKHALLRDAAYESLPRTVRRELHARIASVLEERFQPLVEARPEMLAYHHAAADQKVRAIEYARRAALGSLLRSAFAECLAHAHQALEWLEVLPQQSRQRMEAELGLNSIILPALMSSRGWTVEELHTRSHRSLELIDALGDSPHSAQILWTLYYYFSRCEFQTALSVGERLRTLAERGQDTGLQALVLGLEGDILFLQGRMPEARRLEERVFELHDPVRHQDMGHIFGIDARCCANTVLGLTLWFLGEPDKALEYSLAGVERSRQIHHTISVVINSLWLMANYQLRGEREKIAALAQQGVELSIQHGLRVGEAYSRVYLAWAQRNVEELERQLNTLRGWGELVVFTWFSSLLPDVEAELGRHEPALRHIEEVLQRGRRTGETFWLTVVLELRARIQRETGALEAAEASLWEAIELARTQGARMPELRATTSLCLLLRERGDEARARELLGPLLATFTEGFQLPDLRRATALYQELTGQREPAPPSRGVVSSSTEAGFA